MFPTILLIVLIICMALCIFEYHRSKKEKDGPVFLAIVSGVLLFVLLVIWLSVYCTSIGRLADLEAFFEATKSAYEYTIIATQELEIKAVTTDKPSLSLEEIDIEIDIGELAYQRFASIAGERIKEFRDIVACYNRTLKRYERWNRSWFTEGFVVDVPEELKLIVLK